VIQLIQTFWPELVELGFATYMMTPIVKAVPRSGPTLSFYTEAQYQRWYSELANPGSYKIKYIKGLGTNTAADARTIFKEMRVNNLLMDPEGKENMLMAFSKKEAYQSKRRDFVISFSGREMRELPGSDVTISDFVNEEYILYARASLVRAIPSVVDGLKPSQRKVMHTLLSEGDTNSEIKVAQLAAKVALKTNYHHGEVSLASTIVHMAHDFVGNSNLNLLEPIGQLGTRLLGGKDAASPRYIFTQLSEAARCTFDPRDLPLLDNIVEEGQTVEPRFYMPVLPLVLLLGVEGLAVGMSTQIHPREPHVVVSNLRALLEGTPLAPMPPFWRKFKETVVRKEGTEDAYEIRGVCRRASPTSVVIEELPVGAWTQPHKEFLESVKGVKRVDNLSTESDVHFTVHFESSEDADAAIEADQGHKALKLVRTIYDRNLNAFDASGKLRTYEGADAMLREFFEVRLKAYSDRKQHMLDTYSGELVALEQKYNFIQAIFQGQLVIHMRPKEAIVEEMINSVQPTPSRERALQLLRLPLYSMTEENMQECARQIVSKQLQIRELTDTSIKALWSSDLDKIESCL
jgi:DNA topoisomerase-2